MKRTKERRAEKRLRYELPIWFGKNAEQAVFLAVMVDISNSGMAFDCKADENCPHPGQTLVTRFNMPDFESQAGSAMKSFTRSGCVRRVDDLDGGLCRVGIQFDEPPPFWNVLPS